MFANRTVLKSDEKIIQLQGIDNNLVVYSSQSWGINVVNIENFRQILNLKTNTQKSTVFLFALSPNKKRLTYVSDNFIYVLDTTFADDDKYFKSAKIITKIAINYVATAIKFDSTSTYIFVGTQDNILFQYRYNSLYILSKYNLFDTSKKRTKGITALVFDENTLFVSGNRGDLVKVDIYSKRVKILLDKESTTINDMLIVDNKTIFTGHSNGNLRVVSTKEAKKYTNIETIFTNIKQIVFMKNRKYILVCGDCSYISLVDAQNKKVIAARYMYFDNDVKAMTLVSEYVLIVLLVNNTIIRVDIPTPRELQSYIIHNSLNEAYTLVKKEPMLLESNEYKNLESRYQELVKRVIKEIPNQNKAFAKQTISFFEDVKSKRDEITLIFRAFDSYQKFQDLYFQQEYAIAYNLAHRFPALKSTVEYRKMENTFKQTFQKVQELLLKGKKALAHSLLREYMMATPKKAMIKLFLNHEQEFLKYLDVIRSKDIVQLKRIAEDDPNFSKYLEYLNIDLKDNKLDRNFALITQYLEKGNIEQAKELLNEIDIKENQNLLQKYKEHLQITQELYNAYEEKEFHYCYELIDKNEFLETNKLAQFFEKHWRKLILKAQNYALAGDVQSIQKLFVKFKNLELRKERVEELIKLAFYTEIVSLLELKNYTIAKTFIDDYISLYDYDEMLIPLVEKFNIAAEEQITPHDTESKSTLLKKLKFLK